MSDLSNAFSLVPIQSERLGADGLPRPREPFAWPTPPLPSYPAPTCFIEPEPCEFDSGTGQVVRGLLSSFDPDTLSVQLILPPSRNPLTLRFSQFTRLVLPRPLVPLTPTPADNEALAEALEARPAADAQVTMRKGPPLTLLTLGHVDHEAGLFLFEPVDAKGGVRRIFFPRNAYTSVSFGGRIGDMLVEDFAATQHEVEAVAAEQDELRNRRLGDVLVMQQVVTAEQLMAAVEQQTKMPLVRIGEALLALGYVTETQLDEALQQQKSDRSVALGELMVRKGLVTRGDLQAALARKMGYPLVDVTQFPSEPEALARVPHQLAKRVNALPLMMRGGRLIVALEDPSRGESVSAIEFAAQLKIVPVMARGGLLPEAIERAYARAGRIDLVPKMRQLDAAGPEPVPAVLPGIDGRELMATLEQQLSADAGPTEDERPIEQSDNSLVRLINQMIVEAHAQKVSDIHIETQPSPEKVRIRFRKDGRLQPYLELPHTYRNALIARLKIMCDLDISERRKPQDGKIVFSRFVHGLKLDLRLATIPTAANLEDAVLRLLGTARPLPLDDIGLSEANLAALKAALGRPHGMILCVGPTGSGKTTSLHSALAHLNQPDRKIWTAEDPVEITQAGLRQVQVNPKIDWTFAKALRAFLRADPDVIMVGEVRDQETAQVSIEASLTGHLVLSTLHTNSAAETVTRLLDMGMDPFNFADSLLAVLAQRLVRRLCTHCRVARDATEAEVDELANDWLHAMPEGEARPAKEELLDGWLQRFGQGGRLRSFHAPGCAHCDQTGYRGRAGIHELMTVSRSLRRLIQTGSRADELQKCAMGEGLRTLRQDGIEKVLAGVTHIDEVRASS